MLHFRKVIFFITFFCPLSPANQTFVTTSVADALMHSADYYRWLYTNTISTEDIYNNLSLSPDTDHTSCHRYRQFLLGDKVTVLNETNSEAHISSEFIRYDAATNTTNNDSWIIKKHLASPSLAALYQQIIAAPTTSLWVLTSAWHDEVHNVTFSAGTKIVCDDTQSDENTLSAFLLFSNPERIEQVNIPKNNALPLIDRAEDEARALFVSTLQSFATETEEGILPLVWGGQSMINRIKKSDRKIELKIIQNMIVTEKAWFDNSMPQPLSGVDAPGLMLLAARIANIPFNYNNTNTMLAQMPEAASYEDVKIGDILCVPGLAAAITSLDNNTIVLARGYSAKTGCVIECQIKDLFENVQTIKDIFKLKKAEMPIIIRGNKYQDYKVLSLSPFIKKEAEKN